MSTPQTSEQGKTGVVLVEGFGSLGDRPVLRWFAAPDSWPLLPDGAEEGRGGSWEVRAAEEGSDTEASAASTTKSRSSVLVLCPPAKKDFWRKTYYDPLLVKDDGPFLYTALNADERYTVETSFVLHAQHQFDQAGILIRLDSDRWIKTGIEVVDGRPRLSAVVTNCYSDWSTQGWQSYTTTTDLETNATIVHVPARVRVHCRGTSFVIEAQLEDGPWEFARICHLCRAMTSLNDPLDEHPAVASAWQGPSARPHEVWAGIFGACPVHAGARIEFTDFTISVGSSFDHNADDIHE